MSFRLLPVVVAIPVLALTFWTQAQEPAPESTATSLLPEPAADKVASGVKTLKSLYASDYRRTQDSNKLQAQFGSLGLARKLLKTAAETPPDSDGYYPMLSEAARLATIGNKPDVAFDAIGRLLKTHAIDASAMRLKVLTHFGQRTTRLTDVRTASRFVMPAIQAAADAQKIKTAQALMVVGETMAKRMFDRTMQKSLAQASELLELLRKQEEEVVAALKKIEQKPEDPVANLTVARFMGLRRGDWEGAEVYAALVDEDDIRSLFVREFAAPEDIKEILRLANDWWEFAETQSGAVKLQVTELAAIRYASIVKQLKGFEQKQVETRLAGVIRDHVVAVRVPVRLSSGSMGQAHPPAVAPFNATQAKVHQKAWANHLGVPVATTNSIGMKFVVIPPGEFMMGSPKGEPAHRNDETLHKVTLTKPFQLGMHEVTQEQYQKVMGTNPSKFKTVNHPVEQVTWDEAIEFCARLSDLPAEKRAGRVYRLPTEAEWEYACRAGTTTAYSFGNAQGQLSNYGWWKVNSGGATHPVGLKKPNPWGLYDIHGNVYELCQDWYGGYSGGELTNPKGPVSGSVRVNRGGSWFSGDGVCRSAIRGTRTPGDRNIGLGFRVVRSSIK
jgi:formylglycine-generating enzyme required for sulfatase activity